MVSGLRLVSLFEHPSSPVHSLRERLDASTSLDRSGDGTDGDGIIYSPWDNAPEPT